MNFLFIKHINIAFILIFNLAIRFNKNNLLHFDRKFLILDRLIENSFFYLNFKTK